MRRFNVPKREEIITDLILSCEEKKGMVSWPSSVLIYIEYIQSSVWNQHPTFRKKNSVFIDIFHRLNDISELSQTSSKYRYLPLSFVNNGTS